MKQFITIVIMLLTLGLSPLYAANGQNYYRFGSIDTKLNKRAIAEIAKQEIRRLVLEKKIPKSWKSRPIKKVEKNHKNTSSWVVTFHNYKIKKKKKQTIHIYLNSFGDIKASAYSKN